MLCSVFVIQKLSSCLYLSGPSSLTLMDCSEGLSCPLVSGRRLEWEESDVAILVPPDSSLFNRGWQWLPASEGHRSGWKVLLLLPPPQMDAASVSGCPLGVSPFRLPTFSKYVPLSHSGWSVPSVSCLFKGKKGRAELS